LDNKTKLSGTVQTIKKMTQNDNRPGPGRNHRETAVLRSAEKLFLAKNAFLPNIYLIFILEKSTFFFEQLFPIVARTWLEYRSIEVFLSPKPLFLAKKNPIFAIRTQFWSTARS